MTRNPVQRLFDWKIRGIRWVEIIGFVCVGAMVFSVYVAKAAAARESAAIDQLERQIAENRQRVRLLRAEAARLEQPGRLEDLSRVAGLGPVTMSRQADEAALAGLQPVAPPVPATALATGDAPGPVTLPADMPVRGAQ
ncbi:MAG: cell division protein [Brevundimonas sp.]|uniref:cell division protein FtsL n=1 Tax=Brevundimonas sp. TaxID=1871086 RepID=UPI002737573A|nr:cell division protein [Brevundimonas sp.]MDP3406644.1 cell division protein [Brevundimonas sp.]